MGVGGQGRERLGPASTWCARLSYLPMGGLTLFGELKEVGMWLLRKMNKKIKIKKNKIFQEKINVLTNNYTHTHESKHLKSFRIKDTRKWSEKFTTTNLINELQNSLNWSIQESLIKAQRVLKRNTSKKLRGCVKTKQLVLGSHRPKEYRAKIHIWNLKENKPIENTEQILPNQETQRNLCINMKITFTSQCKPYSTTMTWVAVNFFIRNDTDQN